MTVVVLVAAAVLGGVVAAPAVLATAPRPGRHLPATGRWPRREGTTRALLGATAGLVVLLTLVVGRETLPVVEAFVAAVMVLVAAVDLRVGRLPNVVVLPAIAAVFALLVLTEVFRPATGSFTRAVTTAMVVLVGLTAVVLVLPGRLGMGDTRFMVLPVAALAYGDLWSVTALFLVLAAAVVLATTWSLKVADGRRLAPLGPLITAAFLVTLWAEGPVRAYYEIVARL